MVDETQKFIEVVVDFFNAVEAASVNAKKQISEIVGVSPQEKTLGHDASKPQADPTKLPFNIDKIVWKDKTGEKGPFQLSEDTSSADHQALVKFLTEHAGGRVTTKDSQGKNWFVWIFPNGSTIGRKLK